MSTGADLEKIHAGIQVLKAKAEELHRLGRDFPALSRNAARILAGVKMLELNISDVIRLERGD